jgi:O-antigen ligase/polysaccharide polymerase Wzy-like membrane protein
MIDPRVNAATPATSWWNVPSASVDSATAEAPARAPSASRVAFVGLILLAFVAFLAPQTVFPVLAAARPGFLVATLAIGAAIAARAGTDRSIFAVNRGVVLAGALLGWALITIPLSIWPGGSWEVLTDSFAKAVAIFWLVAAIVDGRERLRHLIGWLSVFSVVPALVTMRHYAAGQFVSGRVVTYDGALTGNPNDLALLLTVMLPLTCALAMTARTRWHRVAFMAIAAAQVGATVVTFSRGGFLGLVAVLAVLCAKAVRRQRLGPGTLAAAVAVVLVGALLIPGRYLEHVRTITDIDADETGSAQERWNDLWIGAGLVLSSPFIGTGIGTDVLALNDVRGARWINLHNVYLRYGIELGMTGLAVFVTLMMLCLRTVRHVQSSAGSSPGSQELARLAEGIEASLVAFAVGGFFSSLSYHFPFYIVAGLAMAAGAIHEAAVPRAAAAVPETKGVVWWLPR